MKKILFSLTLTLAILLGTAGPAWAQTPLRGASSAILKSTYFEPDRRVEMLARFLENYNSPLADYAKEFVAAADFYALDWKLLPAIAGVESTFGKQIPQGSYNAYGWNNGAWNFKSWPDSIWYVTSQLRTRYIDRGAVTIFQIGKIYAPPSPFWAGKVRYFMTQIDQATNLQLSL